MTKSIVIDGHNLTLEKGTGIATYARNLISAVVAEGHEAHILASVPFRPSVKLPALNEIRFVEAKKPDPELPWLWWYRDLRYLAGGLVTQKTTQLSLSGLSHLAPGKIPTGSHVHISQHLLERGQRRFFWLDQMLDVRFDHRVDLFHATFPIPYRIRNVPNIHTIHDLIPLRLPNTTLDDKRYTYRILKQITETSDHIVTVSEFSKQEIISVFGVKPDKITNTYQAVSVPDAVQKRSKDTIASEVRAFFGLDAQEYLLYFGAIEPKKNISALIDAYVGSQVKRSLVVVGANAWNSEGDMKKIEDDQFKFMTFDGKTIENNSRLKYFNYMPRELLYTMIQGARAVLFPSIYEGFGLPVLEAMLLGTPVLTSNVTSLPEVAGEAALLVDPHDLRSIAAGIRTIDSDDDLREHLSLAGRLQAEKFSADAYRQRLKSLYAQVL
jgi:glycosyltransferase involved in cell wall biosynthesis